MYKPKNWKNPYKQEPYPPIFANLSIQEERAFAFEAGADAMLQALESQEHQDWLATPEGEWWLN